MNSLICRHLPVAGILLTLALGLAGCGKTELYAQLDEQQGNEMLALLLENGISSEKRPGKDNLVSLHVDSLRISEAVEVLRTNGLPRESFTTIQDIFSGDKLIYTPFEDNARYNYGLSQEITKTLSQVDGVISVRVHLVSPEEESSEQDAPPSAAVFVKHNPDHDFQDYIPKIKSIVASAIGGLSYDNVTVALFPARAASPVNARYSTMQTTDTVLTVDVATHSVDRFILIVGSLGGLSLLLSIALVVSLMRAGK